MSAAGPKTGLTLHGYWRSGAAWRVRIALALKGLEYDSVAHDLRTGAQRAAAYRALSQQGLVPALETPDGVLTQSGAIIEWLEERYPDPPLLPADPGGRAVVRAMAATIGCDIHPLGNLRVLQYLEQELGQSGAARRAWIARWIGDGFAALEEQVARHGGGFAYGDTPTIADCFLLPQMASAERFGVPVDDFAHLRRVCNALLTHPGIAATLPSAQEDADPV